MCAFSAPRKFLGARGGSATKTRIICRAHRPSRRDAAACRSRYAGTKVYAKPRNGERPARRGGPTGPSNVEACDPGPRGLQSGISLFDTVYTFPDRTRSTEITQDHAPRPRWPLRPPPRAPLRFSSSSRAQWDAEEPRIEL